MCCVGGGWEGVANIALVEVTFEFGHRRCCVAGEGGQFEFRFFVRALGAAMFALKAVRISAASMSATSAGARLAAPEH